MTPSEAQRSIIRRLIEVGIPSDEATFEARILVQQATGLTREALIVRNQDILPEHDVEVLEGLVKRRENREPLAYITGDRGFYGLIFKVSPAVLVPRPETELLVQTALQHLEAFPLLPTLLDVGTGSGCIAISVAVHQRKANVAATDISPAALEIARENAIRNLVKDRISFFEGDLLAPVPVNQRFSVIVSNPPYIAPAEISQLEPEVRDWEPRVALGENPDPLHYYRRLANEAPPYLLPGGMLAVEVGFGQAQAVAKLWENAGLKDIAVLNDLAGIPRVVSGILR